MKCWKGEGLKIGRKVSRRGVHLYVREERECVCERESEREWGRGERERERERERHTNSEFCHSDFNQITCFELLLRDGESVDLEA